MGKFHYNFIFSFHYSVSYKLLHLLVCKSKNLGSWVYQLMIQFIVVSSFFLQDYISFIFLLVFFFVVFSFGVLVVKKKINLSFSYPFLKSFYFIIYNFSIGIFLKSYGY